jgi:hypothetical protein
MLDIVPTRRAVSPQMIDGGFGLPGPIADLRLFDCGTT